MHKKLKKENFYQVAKKYQNTLKFIVQATNPYLETAAFESIDPYQDREVRQSLYYSLYSRDRDTKINNDLFAKGEEKGCRINSC